MNREIRDLMRANAYRLVSELIAHQEEFRLVIWNNNDWDAELPETVMAQYPMQLILDMKGYTLESSFIDEGLVILNAPFSEDAEWTKELFPDDIVAILDLDGKPFVINNFLPEEIKEDKVHDKIHPKTKEDIIKFVMEDGIDKADATRSIEAFAKHNPDKFKQKE